MANANNASVGLKLQPSPQELEFQGNVTQNPNAAGVQLGSQLIRRSQRIAKGVYDFAVQGGAIGTANLYDPSFAPGVSAMPGQSQAVGVSVQKGVFKPLIIPYNAIIVRALIDVITAVTSGGSATIAVGSGVGSTDLLGATGKASFTANTLIDATPNHTAANSIKVLQPVTGSQGVIPFITIATAALTAGKFNVHIEYYLGD